jgi:Fe-S-cluster containining protein
MNREEKVTNGCSGACCERFTLPVTIADLQAMKAEWNRVNTNRNLLTDDEAKFVIDGYKSTDKISDDFSAKRILCTNGYSRLPPLESEVDKLLDMLIPLGETEICPQEQKPFSELYSGVIDGYHSLEYFKSFTNNHFNVTEDKNITAFIYTCKYFDKENHICTNYENRPELCKSFGNNCKYKGCGFVQKLKEAEEKALMEAMN